MDEIKLALCAGKKIDDKVWAEVVKEVDANNDKEITFDEFKDMMEIMFNVGNRRDFLLQK